MFDRVRKKKAVMTSAINGERNTKIADTTRVDKEAEMLDDVSFIKDMRHIKGPWQQYDILLAFGYGWYYMVDSAAYMESADLDDISTITTAKMANMPEEELIDRYRKKQGSIKDFKPLSAERGMLAVGGISRVLKAPVKIWNPVWRGSFLRHSLHTGGVT